MKMIVALFFLLAQAAEIPAAREAVERIRAKTPVEAVLVTSAKQLAGRYTSAPKKLEKRAGPMPGGFDIYLFPNGTYLSCNWTDISPLVVFDKGSWKIVEGLVTLTSDRDVTWNPEASFRYDRRYVIVRRSSNQGESLLLGVEKELAYFETHADDDPSFMLQVVAKTRETAIDPVNATRLKAEIMKKAWRPEFFQEKTK